VKHITPSIEISAKTVSYLYTRKPFRLKKAYGKILTVKLNLGVFMGKTITNSITKEQITKPDPINQEEYFTGGVMITETDPAGIITYANRKFREMTGYSKQELVGAPHNINRHPDMPKIAFETMWKKIKEGEMWEGYVKNMRSDGKFYWVIVWIKPKYDSDGNLTGYIAGRKVPNRDMVEKMAEEYKILKAKEQE
jgi:PAS domain S-box-containing protein